MFTQRRQRAALWLLCGWQVFPIQATHGTKQDCIGVLATLYRCFWQRRTVIIDSNTAHVVVAVVIFIANASERFPVLSSACAITSGPILSPGNTAIW